MRVLAPPHPFQVPEVVEIIVDAPYTLPPEPPAVPPPVLYLSEYLREQQLLACMASAPGAAAQRAYVNGDGSGGLNTNLFLKQTVAGFDNFAVDAFLEYPLTPGTCSSRIYISAHHYILTCGRVHNHDLVDTPTIKVIGSDTRLLYDPTPHTGTIVKFLPADANFYLDSSPGMVNGVYYPAVYAGINVPAYARLKNTKVVGESWWVQPVYANVLYRQFVPTDTLFTWQQQLELYHLSEGGDSGSPVFCGIKGEAVFLGSVCCAHTMANERMYFLLQLITDKMRELAQYYSDPNWATYAPLTVDLAANFTPRS